MNGTLVEKTITHTYTLPSGAVVVVLGVPALCDEESEDGFCAFSPEVADRLSDLIDAAVARNPAPGEVITLRFADDPETIKPKVDFEVRAKGRDFNFGDISLSALEKLVEGAGKAYRIAAKAVAKQRGASTLPPSPKVAFVAPGSVVLGLRGQSAKALFEESDLGRMALDLIIQGAEWAEAGAPPSEDPELVVAALESVRELAKQEGVVELTRYGEDQHKREAIITHELAAKGEERLRELIGRTKKKTLQVFEGLLDVIKLDGGAHLRELTLKPQNYPGKTVDFNYDVELRSELLGLFGHRVRLAVEEESSSEGRVFKALEAELVKEGIS